MPTWRVYYGDGSTYAGDDEDAPHAPRLDVQVIWIENPKRSEGGGIVTGRDFYIYKGDRWWGCDAAGFWDYQYHHEGQLATIFGRTMPSEDAYNDLVQRALKEKLGV